MVVAKGAYKWSCGMWERFHPQGLIGWKQEFQGGWLLIRWWGCRDSMWLLRVRLTARTGKVDSSLANKVGSAITAERGQIRNSDKGQWYGLCPSCGQRKGPQLHCPTLIGLATLRGSAADCRACLPPGWWGSSFICRLKAAPSGKQWLGILMSTKMETVRVSQTGNRGRSRWKGWLWVCCNYQGVKRTDWKGEDVLCHVFLWK